MRIGMGLGPFYASTNLGGGRRRRHSGGNNGQGCLVFLLLLLAFAPAAFWGWWSLFLYIPVILALAVTVVARIRRNR